MPLRQTIYGGECPLDRFKIKGIEGGYDSDPVEACFNCNFADTSLKEFDLEKICKCPSSMAWGKYIKLQKEYKLTPGEHTRQGFWKFVEGNKS